MEIENIENNLSWEFFLEVNEMRELIASKIDYAFLPHPNCFFNLYLQSVALDFFAISQISS